MSVEDYTMTEAEKYLFDLNGFLVVKNVLSPEEVAAANRAIDEHEDEMHERLDTALRNAKPGTPLFGTGPGRKDLAGVLEWELSQSRVFKSILAHPKLLSKFHSLIGKGYRMDHMPFVIAQDKGGEGFALHGGTVDCSSGQYNPHIAYTYAHGTMRSALLACSVVLTDHNPGDGGFCVVPGSHKANLKMPEDMINGMEPYSDFIQQPVTKAGDVVLFSEGTVHGAMAWTAEERQRRVCLYRFAPATCGYGRSYFGSNNINDTGEKNCSWPKAMYEGLTDAERAVLEPPYANRLDRPNICDDGVSVEITTRSEKKKEFDKTVFGTKYF